SIVFIYCFLYLGIVGKDTCLGLPEIISAKNWVFGNCSKIIFINTVSGIDIINPGTPQIYPQNISITKIVITLIEKDFPIKIGSRMVPKITCTEVNARI